LGAEDIEDTLEFLFEAATAVPLKTTEAPQYRRIVLEHIAGTSAGTSVRGPLYAQLHERLEALGVSATEPAAQRRPAGPGGDHRRPPLAVGDGRGVVFVSSRGDVQPSGFLPLAAGNVRQRPLPEIYADSELFRALRDPDRLGGRCGCCEYREPCGGSRARAYAAGGDPLGEDPGCPYEPAAPRAPAGAQRTGSRQHP
jgi:radical SAM protein with 4Fe4S-binding SPASM domain